MKYEKNEIITLTDDREFTILDVADIENNTYLYLKNINLDQYTIVKVKKDKIFNLTNHETSLVLSRMLINRWSY